MGQVCSQEKEVKQDSKAEQKRNRTVTTANDKSTKLVEIDQKEIVLAKLMVQRDRMTSKIQSQEDKIAQLKKTAVLQAKEGNKETALYTVKKIKRVKEFKNNLMKKMDFMDKQVDNIENAMDDVAFTSVLKDSNQVLAKLNEEIDMDEIRLAKEMQDESKMRQQELDHLLDDSDDEDLKDELAQIESHILQQQLSTVNLGPDITKPQETKEPSIEKTKKKQEAMLAG